MTHKALHVLADLKDSKNMLIIEPQSTSNAPVKYHNVGKRLYYAALCAHSDRVAEGTDMAILGR